MKTLAVCLDGVDDEALVAVARDWAAAFASLEVWCAYGEDAERELQRQHERHGHPPPDAGFDREQAESIVQHGVALMECANMPARGRVLAGRDAGHALAAASEANAVLLIAAGHRGGVGPRSVGHVARFVVDHAAGPVVVVRL